MATGENRGGGNLVGNGFVAASFRDIVSAGEHGLGTLPKAIKKILMTKTWHSRIERGKQYNNSSFVEFITHKPMKGCGFKLKDIEALIKASDDHETLALWRDAIVGKHGGDRSSKRDNITLERGTSSSYTVSRLKREFPKLFEDVISGKLSANAAATKAGFRRRSISIQIEDMVALAKTLQQRLGKNKCMILANHLQKNQD